MRIKFNTLASLAERGDNAADILGVSRTRLLIEALKDELDELDELAHDDAFRSRVQDAYYEGRVKFDTVEAILGRETALRVKLLRDSLNQEPPELQLDGDLPTDEAFYDGAVPEWQPAESAPDESGD